MGLSELFVMVASFEFAYFTSRRSAHSLCMSLRFCSIGISAFMSSIYIAFFSENGISLDFNVSVKFNEHFPIIDTLFIFQCGTKAHQPNERWTLYVYFFILAVIQLIFIIIFIFSRRKFRLVKLSFEQLEKKQSFEPRLAYVVDSQP